MQYVTTGQVNWNQVGQSAIGGALGGALSFGVGEMFGHGVAGLGQFATKTLAHGVSGGIQSWAQGGDFGSGFLSGSIGHVSGQLGAGIGGDVGGIFGSSLGGGVAAWADGGDFWQGAQIGVMQYLFNSMGKGIVDAGMGLVNTMLGEQMGGRYGMPSPVTDAASGMAEEAGAFANKYGPDTLGIVGSGLQMVPNPGAKAVGMGLAYAGTA